MSDSTTEYHIAVIPGDGIGKEITPIAQQVLHAAVAGQARMICETYDLGAERYLRDGSILPDDEMERLRHVDAILLGSVGDPRVPSGVLERGLLLKLRTSFDQYANVRPCKRYAGVRSPLAYDGPIDFVVVREGTEGLYCGAGGSVGRGTAAEVATEVSVNTARGVERLVRYAFALALSRRRKLTLVHKTNVLVNAGGLWKRIVDNVAQDFPQVHCDYVHIDAATMLLINDPGCLDVVVTDNLFGDILTDEAAAVVGGVGYAASGCINAAGEYPSMFEPIHGSAPDIAGLGIANPTGGILSVAMMLRHLGLATAAERVETAVEADIAEHQGVERSTERIGRDILARMA